MPKVFVGSTGIEAFRATRIEGMLRAYALAGHLRPGVTPSGLLEAASQITGKTFEPGEYLKAADALGAWIAGSGGYFEVAEGGLRFKD
jgi:hypothetical protein